MKPSTSMRMPALIAALAAAALAAGCAGHHPAGSMQPMAPNLAPASPLALSTSTPSLSSGYQKVAAPAGAKLYFINLKHGDVVSSPVLVQFGLAGMGVAPAGIEKAGTGHHHLLVNVNQVDANAPLPANDTHRHFGAGQTETRLELQPGQHTLQLMLGDQNHIPHHPPLLSERIVITVK